jgi:hypothetical protein
MEIDFIRNYCLTLPHTTEELQWVKICFLT